MSAQPSRTDSPVRRERILEAAASLFAGRDASLVTMDDVAARAKVAKGTLYNYFSSKDDLYFSILTVRMQNLLEALRGLFLEEEDAKLRLRKYVVHTMMFLLKYPDFFRILRREEAGRPTRAPAALHALRQDLRDLLHCVIERGTMDGTIRSPEPALAVDMILGALEGAALRCLEGGIRPSRGSREAEIAFQFLWGMLRVDGMTMQGPLVSATVLVTREEGPDEGLGLELTRLGARVLRMPLVQTIPPADGAALRIAASRGDDYDWILFTSARGVRAFVEAGGAPVRARIGAVGDGTARLARTLLGRVDLIAEERNSAGLAQAMRDHGVVRGRRVLVPRAEQGRVDLGETLRADGALVDDVIAYRTVPATVDAAMLRDRLGHREIDVVTFASGSAVRAFGDLVGFAELHGPCRVARIVSIGPSTSEALRGLGIEPDEEAYRPSMEGLAEAAARAVARCDRAGRAPETSLRKEAAP